MCTVMHSRGARTRPKVRQRRGSRQLAVCTGVHQPVRVASRLLRTGDYPEEARVRLGEAVTRARIAAGWPGRPEFIGHVGIGLRSLKYLEQGNRSVSAKILDPVAAALPHWTEDTPKEILEGGEPPALAAAVPPKPSIPEPGPIVTSGELADHSNISPGERRRIIRRSIDQLPLALDVSQSVYEAWREDLIRLIVKYEPREDEE